MSKIEELNTYAITSASLGNIDHVIDYISKGADDKNQIAKIAAKYGYNNILGLMIGKGADNFKEISYYAAKHCQDLTIDFLKEIDKFDENYEELYYKAKTLRDYTINWQLSNKINTPQEIANNAALRGDIETVIKMIENGAQDLMSIAINATSTGHYEIILELLDLGISKDKENIEKLKECAEKTYHYTICDILNNL